MVDQSPDLALADQVPRLHCQLHPGRQVQLVLGGGGVQQDWDQRGRYMYVVRYNVRGVRVM